MMQARGAAGVPLISEAPEGERSLDELFERVEEPKPALAVDAGLRAARVVSMGNRAAMIEWRGSSELVAADIASGVEAELIEECAAEHGSVLVEPGPPATIVGVLQTRRPRDLKLRAKKIEIEGESEVVLRAGRSALRLREDGDIELVGSRIHAASRGLFRLVGRILRLN
jgi:hypothetical protein